MGENIVIIDKVNTKSRSSNIELLRVLAMLAVIALHYNNPSMGGAFKLVEHNSLNYYVLYFVESLCICAVNVFVLISGYFMCTNNKRYLIKPLQLIFQVSVFSSGTYILRVFTEEVEFSACSLFRCMIPQNYFVILYITLYLISPYINLVMESINIKQFKRMLAMLLLVFSVYPSMVDVGTELLKNKLLGLSSIGAWGSQYGYTIINFALMYIVGGFLRKYDVDKYVKYKRSIIIGILSCSIILTAWARVNDYIGFFDERSAWEYCNPIIIIESILLFLLFNKITLKESKLINSFAKASFTVFLMHTIFLPKINIQRYVNQNTIVLLGHLVLSSVAIYLICWMIHKIYDGLTTPLFNLLNRKCSLFRLNIGIEE